MNLHNFNYGHPYAAILLLMAFILFFAFFLLSQYRHKKIAEFARPHVLKDLLINRQQGIFWLKVLGICLIWILATLAIMDPLSYGEYPQELRQRHPLKSGQFQKKPFEIIFVVDASASMQVTDVKGAGQRFLLAKEIVDNIIRQLVGQQVALQAFTSNSEQLSPLTTDYLFVRMMLREMQINEGGSSGTNFSNAFKAIRETYFNNQIDKAIILLSDGGDTLLEASKEDQQKRMTEILSEIKDTKEFNARFFVIGIGSKQGGEVPGVTFEGHPVISKLNESLLQNIAQQGNGKYFQADEVSTIHLSEIITKELNQDVLAKTKDHQEKDNFLIKKLLFQIPLGIAILILIGVIFFPDSLRKTSLLIFLLFSFGLHSDEITDMMQNAQDFYDVKNYAKAREIYQKLLQTNLEPWQRAHLLYNVGTTYLADKEWQEATTALRSVPLKDSSSPLLHYRDINNLILANFGDLPNENSITKSKIEDLKKALSDIPKADNYFCRLQIAMGNEECLPNKHLQELQTFIERFLAATLQTQSKVSLNTISFQDGLKIALEGINQIKEHIDFLENEKMSPTLRKSYQTIFLQENRLWTALWVSLRGKLPQKDPSAEERKKLFQAAASYFLQALHHMEMGSNEMAQSALNQSEEKIQQLLKLPPPPSHEQAPSPTSEEPAKKQMESVTTQEDPSIKQATQMLLEMDQLDRIKTPMPKAQTKDPRPW